ncbi:hypothetical protein EXIGLDRAFT_90215 [Exidia glandulosa HHB12029]|uniref:Uncharacterized protein n=1 Tax=Exidia glandulosa HHB12029 TaxID=1314781 RepID=A0A165HBS8_EXIGL|nr:hypothetical protein EXIGLDRAFT_90215 [Exidia glandulosa HHB12029]
MFANSRFAPSPPVLHSKPRVLPFTSVRNVHAKFGTRTFCRCSCGRRTGSECNSCAKFGQRSVPSEACPLVAPRVYTSTQNCNRAPFIVGAASSAMASEHAVERPREVPNAYLLSLTMGESGAVGHVRNALAKPQALTFGRRCRTAPIRTRRSTRYFRAKCTRARPYHTNPEPECLQPSVALSGERQRRPRMTYSSCARVCVPSRSLTRAASGTLPFLGPP